ncbi:glutamine-hydrolyzing GMP synthase [candidate division CSSED10-310 bacterium]|uniref:GMP synthase [glutamine-hydrolyzing] n=1 Tax=candidate division CSSED10-310 bacterium TaxID=2855610 RepID=A0ABV6Z667_UNCC1
MEKIIILDFGSQYTQLIARRVREQQVYSEIVPYTIAASDLVRDEIRGIILSGGPSSVDDHDAPHPDPALFTLDKPILGICYGIQLLAFHLGGTVSRSPAREYGYAELEIVARDRLFTGLEPGSGAAESVLQVWMSHGDKITRLPPGFSCIGRTNNSDFAAIVDQERKLYGLQFHPEVIHTTSGSRIISNFIFQICHCRPHWTMESFIQNTVIQLRETVGSKKVLCALSGGVDSSVLAVLLHKAVGSQSHCIFVDNGLLRKGEGDYIQNQFAQKLELNITVIDARQQFLARLAAVGDPEKKRRIIGDEFIRVFLESAGEFNFLAQGTLYPDVIESVSTKGPSATIKTHHNRVPQILELIKQGRVIEPLKELFKDEVRQVGSALGLPDEIIYRHPFPGPGLAIRVIGPVDEERLVILREADAIVRQEISSQGWHRKLWQAFAILLPVQSVGVMGDKRTYENSCVLRMVQSQDAMTAEWARIPYSLLARISERIINEIPGINRVLYDISSKPPATIEWE